MDGKIDLHGQAGLPFINKRPFTGSFAGMRYRLRKKTIKPDGGGEDEIFLEACVYPEPYCFEATPEEEKVYKEFPFTDGGFEEAVAWLNEMHGEYYPG